MPHRPLVAPLLRKKGDPGWRTWSGQLGRPGQTSLGPAKYLRPVLWEEKMTGVGGPWLHGSPFPLGQGARSRMTTAGLPLPFPCTCLGLKRGGRWLERAPARWGGRMPGAGGGGQIEAELHHICSRLTAPFSGCRERGGIPVPGGGSRLLSHRARFCVGGQAGPCPRYRHQIGREQTQVAAGWA